MDTSLEMLKQARQLDQDIINLNFVEAAAQKMPFGNAEFDRVVCSMTINTFSSEETVRSFFQEVARVLKSNGRLGVSLPNPFTLDAKTKFRWTEWEKGQTQLKLIPGEAIKRKIMGKNGEMLTVVNYYWPPDFLINIAGGCNLTHKKTLEPTATDKDVQQYQELDPLLRTTPFFLVMAFDKN